MTFEKGGELISGNGEIQRGDSEIDNLKESILSRYDLNSHQSGMIERANSIGVVENYLEYFKNEHGLEEKSSSDENFTASSGHQDTIKETSSFGNISTEINVPEIKSDTRGTVSLEGSEIPVPDKPVQQREFESNTEAREFDKFVDQKTGLSDEEKTRIKSAESVEDKQSALFNSNLDNYNLTDEEKVEIREEVDLAMKRNLLGTALEKRISESGGSESEPESNIEIEPVPPVSVDNTGEQSTEIPIPPSPESLNIIENLNYDENSSEAEKAFAIAIENAENFDDIRSAIEAVPGRVQSLQGWSYSRDQLIDIINRVERDGLSTNFVTRNRGLRDKVDSLLPQDITAQENKVESGNISAQAPEWLSEKSGTIEENGEVRVRTEDDFVVVGDDGSVDITALDENEYSEESKKLISEMEARLAKGVDTERLETISETEEKIDKEKDICFQAEIRKRDKILGILKYIWNDGKAGIEQRTENLKAGAIEKGVGIKDRAGQWVLERVEEFRDGWDEGKESRMLAAEKAEAEKVRLEVEAEQNKKEEAFQKEKYLPTAERGDWDGVGDSEKGNKNKRRILGKKKDGDENDFEKDLGINQFLADEELKLELDEAVRKPEKLELEEEEKEEATGFAMLLNEGASIDQQSIEQIFFDFPRELLEGDVDLELLIREAEKEKEKYVEAEERLDSLRNPGKIDVAKSILNRLRRKTGLAAKGLERVSNDEEEKERQRNLLEAENKYRESVSSYTNTLINLGRKKLDLDNNLSDAEREKIENKLIPRLTLSLFKLKSENVHHFEGVEGEEKSKKVWDILFEEENRGDGTEMYVSDAEREKLKTEGRSEVLNPYGQNDEMVFNDTGSVGNLLEKDDPNQSLEEVATPFSVTFDEDDEFDDFIGAESNVIAAAVAEGNETENVVEDKKEPVLEVGSTGVDQAKNEEFVERTPFNTALSREEEENFLEKEGNSIADQVNRNQDGSGGNNQSVA